MRIDLDNWAQVGVELRPNVVACVIFDPRYLAVVIEVDGREDIRRVGDRHRAGLVVRISRAVDIRAGKPRRHPAARVVLERLLRAAGIGDRREGIFASGPAARTVGVGSRSGRIGRGEQQAARRVVAKRRRTPEGIGDAGDASRRVVGDRQCLSAGVSQAGKLIVGVSGGDRVAVGVAHEVESAIGQESSHQSARLGQLVGPAGNLTERCGVAGWAEIAVGPAAVGLKTPLRVGRFVDDDRAVGESLCGLLPGRIPAPAQRTDAVPLGDRVAQRADERERQSGRIDARIHRCRERFQGVDADRLLQFERIENFDTLDVFAEPSQVLGVVAQDAFVVAPGGSDLGLQVREHRRPGIRGNPVRPQLVFE